MGRISTGKRLCPKCRKRKKNELFDTELGMCRTCKRKQPLGRQPRPLPIRPGYIYVAKCEWFYKIGCTSDLLVRHKNPTDNPFDITYIHTYTSNHMGVVERALQRHLMKYHHRGEWFKLPPEIVVWLQSISDIDAEYFAGTLQRPAADFPF